MEIIHVASEMCYITEKYKLTVLQIIIEEIQIGLTQSITLYRIYFKIVELTMCILHIRLTPFPGFPGFLQKFMVYLLPLMVA